MKVLMVIAKEGFQDHEFKVPYDKFLEKKITVDVASVEKGDCIGKFGLQAVADRSFSDVVIQEYIAVVLVGGPGSAGLVGNPDLEKILKSAVSQNIIIGAICYAPVILARAGILKDRKATVWNNNGEQGPVLEEEGAEFVDELVVVDDQLVTANGPPAAEQFADELIKLIECSDCWIKGAPDE
mgnify:CR=1 FL=1